MVHLQKLEMSSYLTNVRLRTKMKEDLSKLQDEGMDGAPNESSLF